MFLQFNLVLFRYECDSLVLHQILRGEVQSSVSTCKLFKCSALSLLLSHSFSIIMRSIQFKIEFLKEKVDSSCNTLRKVQNCMEVYKVTRNEVLFRTKMDGGPTVIDEICSLYVWCQVDGQIGWLSLTAGNWT